MAKHHYIPAAAIGLFSKETRGPRRKRVVATLRRGQTVGRDIHPNRILWSEDLYITSEPGSLGHGHASVEPDFVDVCWKSYEDGLPDAIERLVVAHEIDASLWLCILVPYVAAIFARGREFEDRFTKRAREFAFSTTGVGLSDTVNHSRLLEMQWLFAPICASSWVVVHAPDGMAFITNDLGVAPAIRTNGDGTTTHGWIVPLTRSAVLFVIPDAVREVMYLGAGGIWLADVRHRSASAEQVHELNRSIAASCRQQIIGPDQVTVECYAAAASDDAAWSAETVGEDIMEGWIKVPAQVRHDHEHDWHILVSIAAKQVTKKIVIDLDDVDWSTIGAIGWKGPVFFDADKEFAHRSGVSIAQDDDGGTWVQLNIRGETVTRLKYVDGQLRFVSRTVTLEPQGTATASPSAE